MKKIILSIAVVLASMTGFSALAQTPDNSSSQANTESTTRPSKQKAPRYNPFAGLNLSEQQQSQLQALRSSKETKMQNKNTDAKNITSAEKQALRKQRAENRIQKRRDYLAEVKTILTPEQYMQFLENSYVEQGGVNGKNKMDNGKRRDNKNQAMRGGKNRSDNQNARGQKMRTKNAGDQTASNQADSTYYIDNGLIKVFPYHAQR